MRLILALVAVVLSSAGVSAQTPTPAPAPGTANFTIFAGTTPIGTEEVTVSRISDGWRISSTGGQRAPAQLTINTFELTLAADWHPRELKIDALLNQNQAISSITTFAVTTAVTDYTQNGRKASVTHQISSRTIPLPNAFYAPYEVLAARLTTSQVGTPLKMFVVPQTEIDAVVRGITEQKVSTLQGVVTLKRYEVAVQNPGGEITLTVDVDERGRLARMAIPRSQLSLVREDLAGVSTRSITFKNPGDENVFIGALGFNIAATITKPANAPSKAPAIVMIGGSGPTDRDEMVHGIPIFGELAGQLAQAGYFVVRYDKRGVGQSGGRFEAAGLAEYADDARAVVKWLSNRKDVDKDRIALVGHSEGAAVALLTAEKEKKVKAVAMVAGPGTTGYELILEQQRFELERLKTPQAERDAKIALQRQVMDAAVKGTGWEGVPPQIRATADTPWFRSFLLFDPAKTISKVKQPLIVVQPSLDTQVRPHHADKIVAAANKRKKVAATELVTLPGINHLLVPAQTGEVVEYSGLTGTPITPDVSRAIVRFLQAVMPPKR